MPRRERLQPPGSQEREQKRREEAEERATGLRTQDREAPARAAQTGVPGKQGAGRVGGRDCPPNGPHGGPAATQARPFLWLLCPPVGLGMHEVFSRQGPAFTVPTGGRV